MEESEFKEACVFPNESIGLGGGGDKDCVQPPPPHLALPSTKSDRTHIILDELMTCKLIRGYSSLTHLAPTHAHV